VAQPHIGTDPAVCALLDKEVIHAEKAEAGSAEGHCQGATDLVVFRSLDLGALIARAPVIKQLGRPGSLGERRVIGW
jgi:hypothetical protein